LVSEFFQSPKTHFRNSIFAITLQHSMYSLGLQLAVPEPGEMNGKQMHKLSLEL